MLMRVRAIVERSCPTRPARWYAMMQPATPPPMMTTRAGSMGGDPLPGGEAAVDDQLRARHERGLVAGQEQDDVGDLPRLRDPPERDAGLELFPDRVGEIGRLERRVDDPGVDHVAADLVPGELDR